MFVYTDLVDLTAPIADSLGGAYSRRRGLIGGFTVPTLLCLPIRTQSTAHHTVWWYANARPDNLLIDTTFAPDFLHVTDVVRAVFSLSWSGLSRCVASWLLSYC